MVDPALRLTKLLSAWKRTRSPRVGALVDLAGAKAAGQGAEPVGVGKKKADHQAWLALAAKAGPEDLDRLLAGLCGGTSSMSLERLDAVAGREDPRIASRLVAIFAAPPYTAKTALPFYGRAVEVLAARGDARHAAAVAELAERYLAVIQTSVGELLQRKLRKAAAALAGVSEKPLGAAEDKLCAELEKEWTGERKQADHAHAGRAAAGKTAAELLRDIHEHPDDDAARLVYADWLSERQDPLGELIVLQIARARGDAGADAPERWQREVELIQKHRKAWCGALGMVATEVELRRGFPAAVTLGKNLSALKKVSADPAWRTVEDVLMGSWWRGESRAAKDFLALLADPELRALRRVARLPVSAYLDLRGRGAGARWDALGFLDVPEGTAAVAGLLAALDGLVRVREVGFWLPVNTPPDALGFLLGSPVAGKIDMISVTGGRHPIGEWLAAVSAAGIPAFRHEWGTDNTFRGDELIVRGGATHSLKFLVQAVAELPAGSLNRVELRPRHVTAEAPEGELQPLAAVVRARSPQAQIVIKGYRGQGA